MKTIDQLHADVQRAFDAALKCADSSAKCTVTEKEEELWTKMLALGAALMTLFLFRQVARHRPTKYEQQGKTFVLAEAWRCTWIGTRFGKVPFVRPVGRQVGSRAGRADLPVDRELGLCGGFSLGVATAIARLCAMMAFAQARTTFALFHEWTPSSRATLRLVDAVGSEARVFIEQAPAPEGDRDILVVQVDGRGAPMITTTELARRGKRRTKQARQTTRRARRRARHNAHPKIRRKKGDKSKNAKVGFVAVIYTLKTTKGGLEGPINKQSIATFENHRALMLWAKREALERGYGKKRTLFHRGRLRPHLASEGRAVPWCRGLPGLVPRRREALGNRRHAPPRRLRPIAHLGRRMHRPASRWQGRRAHQQAQVLQATHPEDETQEPQTRQRHRHPLGEHLENMRYDELRRDGLDIGSGAVEGAVRNVIAMRLDGPGMRWGRERSELLLHLRCILVSGQWDAFATYLAARNGVTLKPQPIPASPYAQAA